MFSFVYNLCLALMTLFLLPQWLWQRLKSGKYRESLKQRLGIHLPAFSPKEGQEVIWIHAVSMGETYAVTPLFRILRERYPEAAVVISSTTETGHRQAKHSMQGAAAHFFLPLDFSFLVRRILNRIKPSMLILCESDFWYHLLTLAKERGTRIALVNGKVSERSCTRFRRVPFLTRRIFASFDVFCVQSQLYLDRFVSMGVSENKLHATGNLKFDPLALNSGTNASSKLKDQLHLLSADRVLVIGSSHAPEEQWFLQALVPVWKKIPNLKVLLVPRHPERFNDVAHLLEKSGVQTGRFSQGCDRQNALILIDAMGILAQCYALADLAIVAGSYVSHVGGHNLFEPVLQGIPVLFGPHTHNQSDFRHLILEASAGREVPLSGLSQVLIELLEPPGALLRYTQACRRLAASVRGATERTLDHLFPA